MFLHAPASNRIIVGISGASGIIYGIRLLEALKTAKVETHLVVSRASRLTLASETSLSLDQLYGLADVVHAVSDMAASIASGSFITGGMIVAPCSVRTLAEIATGVTTTLLTRAADVVLKERRRLVLMVRESPLHSIHLRHMLTLSDMGAIIAPPVPAFYNVPDTIGDIVDHSVGRVLDLFGLQHSGMKRWEGMKELIGHGE